MMGDDLARPSPICGFGGKSDRKLMRIMQNGGERRCGIQKHFRSIMRCVPYNPFVGHRPLQMPGDIAGHRRADPVDAAPTSPGVYGQRCRPCVHSFSEAGCGKDINCEDCRIKAAIVSAFSGIAMTDTSTTLSIRRDNDMPYAIAVSTEQVGGYALVRIDRFEEERPHP
jgi:hypothetical protein